MLLLQIFLLTSLHSCMLSTPSYLPWIHLDICELAEYGTLRGFL
jgi:hypothetical protein